jgi:hypothetical protein
MKISIVLAALTGSFETDMNRASKTAQKRLKEVEKTAKQVGAAAGVALAAAAGIFGAAIKNAIDRADELSKTAQKIGITTEALSTLSYAAKLADVDLGQLQGGLSRLTKFQDDASKGAERNIALFERLGIEFKNTDGTLRDTGEVFRDFADRLSKLPDGADKSAIALEAFGRSGANLIPLLNSGADGIQKLEDRARRLGLELSERAGKDAEELNDRLSDLWSVVDGLAFTVAQDLLPDIIDLTDALAETIREGGGMVEVGRDIADLFRGVAKIFEAAGLAADSMGERFNIVSNYQNILFNPLGWQQYRAEIDKSNARLEELAETGRKLALAARQDFGIDPKDVRWIDPPAPRGRRRRPAGTPMQDGETVEINAGEGFGAGRGGSRINRAAAEAARAAEAAARQLEDQIREAERAQADFLATTEDLRAELAGPLAQVQLDYIRREDELIALGKLAGLTQEELASSLDLLEQARLRDVAAIDEQVRAAREYAQALADAPLVAQMDQLRDVTGSFFADLVKNGRDAIDRLQDYLLTSALESIGKQIAEGLFGDFGTTGAGSKGSGFAAIFGSLFGGARANGGPVYPGKAFLVGERGPELFIPRSAGDIANAEQTSRMGSRSMNQTINFNVQGTISKRSRDQINIDMQRAMQRSLRERA